MAEHSTADIFFLNPILMYCFIMELSCFLPDLLFGHSVGSRMLICKVEVERKVNKNLMLSSILSKFLNTMHTFFFFYNEFIGDHSSTK